MGLLDGITKGVTKGLTYIGSFVSDFVWAAEHISKDHQPLNDLLPVAKTFVSEMLDTSGNLLPNIIGSLIAGGDPFAGSRHQYQQWRVKWKH